MHSKTDQEAERGDELYKIDKEFYNHIADIVEIMYELRENPQDYQKTERLKQHLEMCRIYSQRDLFLKEHVFPILEQNINNFINYPDQRQKSLEHVSRIETMFSHTSTGSLVLKWMSYALAAMIGWFIAQVINYVRVMK